MYSGEPLDAAFADISSGFYYRTEVVGWSRAGNSIRRKAARKRYRNTTGTWDRIANSESVCAHETIQVT